MKIMHNKVEEIIERYNFKKESLLAVLQDIQKEYNFLPKEAMNIVSEKLDVPLAKISSLATFYSSFSLKEKGKNTVSVCTGTACHVRGAQGILKEIERDLGIKEGETDAKKEFTLEKVNCVGACALGPLVVINEDYHGNLTPDIVGKVLSKYKDKKDGDE